MMDQRVRLVGLLFLTACAGSPAVSHAARAASPARRGPDSASAPVGIRTPSAPAVLPASPPLDYDSETDNDQAYLDNTRRAVELYREFIDRAGTDPQYAAAVKRSREQIEDLTNSGIFVGRGMRERAKK
jgi:hypothetical protein